jgi:septum site-determining protein MinC
MQQQPPVERYPKTDQLMANESLVQIKGVREGLLISALTGSWAERKLEILKLVKEKGSFFTGACVCLDVGDTLLRVKEITLLQNELAESQITLWAILSQSQVTQNNAKALGFAIPLTPKKETIINDEKKQDDGERAVLVNKTLRAGYRVAAKEHVIIFGDVNPGAEIISAGNIIVWGKLRGSAIAGADGNMNAVVCALELNPTLLKIGETVFTARQKKSKTLPEMAFVENEECKIEIWHKEKER